MSTNNLCFGAKIRKIGLPMQTPVLLYKSGVQGSIHYTDMFSCWDMQVPPVRKSAGTFGVKSFNPSWFDNRPPHDKTRKGFEKVVKKKLFF